MPRWLLLWVLIVLTGFTAYVMLIGEQEFERRERQMPGTAPRGELQIPTAR